MEKGVRVGREEEQQEKGEKESKMRNEGDDSAASDTILEAVVDVSLSRIFEMGTECEHGAGATSVFFVSAAGIRRVSYPRFSATPHRESTGADRPSEFYFVPRCLATGRGKQVIAAESCFARPFSSSFVVRFTTELRIFMTNFIASEMRPHGKRLFVHNNASKISTNERGFARRSISFVI